MIDLTRKGRDQILPSGNLEQLYILVAGATRTMATPAWTSRPTTPSPGPPSTARGSRPATTPTRRQDARSVRGNTVLNKYHKNWDMWIKEPKTELPDFQIQFQDQ